MSLSHHDITLVQTTFSQIEPIAGTAADLFYQRLFDIDPSLRALFPEDMHDQKRKLMQMIGVAVNGLNRLDEIAPTLRALGARHTGYGVKAEHYDTVGAALLWALEQGLQNDFTEEVKGAWTAVYRLLATTALEGAHTI
jgi:hemoglobin-like flavoprotein